MTTRRLTITVTIEANEVSELFAVFTDFADYCTSLTNSYPTASVAIEELDPAKLETIK